MVEEVLLQKVFVYTQGKRLENIKKLGDLDKLHMWGNNVLHLACQHSKECLEV